jgi:hypothetical protein
VLARVAALPGVHLPGPFGGEVLRGIGSALNRSVSLEWVPPDDRWAVLYILLLPTAALLIALARLTFGLRVLGFRSILIAVGFQEIGILPSLLLMAIVVGIILAVRPPMQRIQLTFYARTSVILGIAAVIMVAALLLGPWLRSETLWSFAFFPVIILAMLAEGVAPNTVGRVNLLVNRMLPGPSEDGDRAVLGRDAKSRVSPSILTYAADRNVPYPFSDWRMLER